MHFLSNTVVVFCRLWHTIKKDPAGGLWVRLHISGVWSSLLYSFNSLCNHKSASPEQISNISRLEIEQNVSTTTGHFVPQDILCSDLFYD